MYVAKGKKAVARGDGVGIHFLGDLAKLGSRIIATRVWRGNFFLEGHFTPMQGAKALLLSGLCESLSIGGSFCGTWPLWAFPQDALVTLTTLHS
jgi:hypothetical protein